MSAKRFSPYVPSILALIVGCGADLAPIQPATVVPDEIAFTEDADPVMAALAFKTDELLVQSYPGVSKAELQVVFEGVGAVVSKELGEIALTVLTVDPNSWSTTAAALADSGLIETVQKNYLYEPSEIPSDTLYERQSYLTRVGVDRAWDLTVGDEEVLIAIVDTGVDPDHPEFANKIVAGWNTVDENADFRDVMGHGTMVAGVAAALSDNGQGIAGVSWNSSIVAVRVMDDEGKTSASDIAAGILWASGRGARVINVSFAPLWSNRVIRSAVQRAYHQGSLVVISAGNGGGVTESSGYSEALFVGATSSSGAIARFSDQGPFVDLAAPGVGIQVTLMGGEYGSASGTSFSAPIVSGVAALVWSVNPDLRPISVQEAILNSTVDAGPTGKDSIYGHGTLDAEAAVRLALSTTVTRDTRAPTLTISRPIDGAVLSRRTTATVSAVDRWGVADVVMSVDGIPSATDTRAPYRFVLDPEKYSNGTHEVSFVATDAAGNASMAATVTVTFRASTSQTDDGAATVTFSSPRSGATVRGNVTIAATVSDPDGLTTVEWFVDGVAVFASSVSGSSTGVSYLWRSSDSASGSHTITLVLTDRRGNRTVGDLELVTP